MITETVDDINKKWHSIYMNTHAMKMPTVESKSRMEEDDNKSIDRPNKSQHPSKSPEQLIKEQILSRVQSHFNCPNSDLFLPEAKSTDIPVSNALEQNRDKFMNIDQQHANKLQSLDITKLKSKSEPPFRPNKPVLLTSQSDGNHEKLTHLETLDVIAAEGQRKPSSIKHPVTELDQQAFVDFVKEKFNNMSLSHIKNIIEDLPNTLLSTNHARKSSIIPDKSIHQNDNTLDVGANTRTQPKRKPSIQVACRASIDSRLTANCEPRPQHTALEQVLYKNYTVPAKYSSPDSTSTLHIPRSPITCPIADCTCNSVFVSEFTKHIRVNHVRVPAEVLQPNHMTNLFIDTELDDLNVNRCRLLYLVTDKIENLGSNRYKNYLPVLLMTARVDLRQLLFPRCRHRRHQWTAAESSRSTDLCTLIWLTGLCPSEAAMHYTLTAWHRNGDEPCTHLVHSGRLYSIRAGQEPVQVYGSGQAMLLRQRQVQELSADGTRLMRLQVVVY